MSNNSSVYQTLFYCSDFQATKVLHAFVICKCLLMLPLCVFVLYLGYQQWRRQQSSSRTTNHSDVITFHQMSMEIISITASVVYLCGILANLPMMTQVAYYVHKAPYVGEILFHLLTCVERYLAVVHPITYLGLKQSGGVKIRNISIVCVWLLCFGWIWVEDFYAPQFPFIPLFSMLAASLLVISYCSLSVICALIRPGPGKVGRAKEQVDQSKQRAFQTVVAILAVLWLMFLVLIVCSALDSSQLLSERDGCVALMSALWFSLPSSFVLPLLFLHRAGKLLCGHYSNE